MHELCNRQGRVPANWMTPQPLPKIGRFALSYKDSKHASIASVSILPGTGRRHGPAELGVEHSSGADPHR
ncbi:hypothetical protein GCM10011488_64730 [Steroidobacter agaridevorans]|nr:hypothetical protein GCM10011488_64730 [Steroidobacter agaridevorans]